MAEIVCRRLNSVFSAKLVREITQNPRPRSPLQVSIISMGNNTGYPPWAGWTAEILCRYISGSEASRIIEMQAQPRSWGIKDARGAFFFAGAVRGNVE